ncbi:MAG: ABC transporter ATP-binding protein/permease [Lachnospiraceae bacterium]|nr:ABC transporter ATP-binding protein/permease [Lachnospiraceae bacterium]
MLELKNIKKDYPAGSGVVHALKGIDLKFRHNEFVSILGPSGCGKTTMLNIIGGLDKYTDGDLIINGTSTKKYKDRDWDSYRNHTIGFVFQSYNLIPHQSVLMNVELALTLSGVSKSERKRRAKEALEKVGLGDQIHKKPNKMSGGQMQRVAIARAIVNNPDIIMADEPTGALDTETSIQVMDILKEIAKDRLVIMVTHNPDLAERYSTRIIKMLDGKLLDDSNPLTEDDVREEKRIEAQKASENQGKKRKRKEKKPSMSFGTSFGLSLKNLFTKKGRTILTAFAGSIGIIGIALISSVSNGLNTYIDQVQEETLSSYPLTIEASSVDLSTLLTVFMGGNTGDREHGDDGIYMNPIMYDMIDALNNAETTENDLKSFKQFIESERANKDSDTGLDEALAAVQYSYDLNLLVYTENIDGTIQYSDSEELLNDLITEYMGIDMSYMDTMDSSSGNLSAFSSMSSMSSMTGSSELWSEMIEGDDGALISDMVFNQYDLVYGSWPNDYNEVVVVLDENNELTDMSLYALGLISEEEMGALMKSVMDGSEATLSTNEWSYEDLCNREYKVILNSSCYSYDENSGLYTDLRDTEAGIQYLYNNAIPLKVVGVIKPNEDANAGIIDGSIAYTSALTKYVIEESGKSEAIQAQIDSPNKDVISGLPFKTSTTDLSDADKAQYFLDYIEELTDEEKATLYGLILTTPPEAELEQMVDDAMADVDRATMEENLRTVMEEQLGMAESDIDHYFEDLSDEDMATYYRTLVEQQIRAQYAATASEQIATMSPEQLVAGLTAAVDNYTTEEEAYYYDEVLEFSESNYEANLTELGYVDIESPTQIALYSSDFDSKDVIEDAIEIYNEDKEELEQITYTDYVGLMMGSVSMIINAISYVLIAFVSISLIVSSIMIGVITLISVQERTKEIGILRAIGASKKNVSRMFNAETIIIGFVAGLLGVVISALLCLPINAVIHHLTDIHNLNASLPVGAAVILIMISILLTMLAGLIPSRSAAKKDPVEALRSE